MLVRRLQPWSSNANKRLVRSPKVYICDSGLLHALLELESWNDIVAPDPRAKLGRFRYRKPELLPPATAGNPHSIVPRTVGDRPDIGKGGKAVVGVKVKRSSAPTVRKRIPAGLRRPQNQEVLCGYPGTERFPIGDGVEALPCLIWRRNWQVTSESRRISNPRAGSNNFAAGS